jgi:hypothetical protein
MTHSRRLSLTVLVLALFVASVWYYSCGRFVQPHTKLIFTAPRQCVLYVPNSRPEDFLFTGNELTSKIENRTRVHTITILGEGTIKYKTTQIAVTPVGVRVGDQVLDHDWCSYLMDRSGRVRTGEIRTAE